MESQILSRAKMARAEMLMMTTASLINLYDSKRRNGLSTKSAVRSAAAVASGGRSTDNSSPPSSRTIAWIRSSHAEPSSDVGDEDYDYYGP